MARVPGSGGGDPAGRGVSGAPGSAPARNIQALAGVDAVRVVHAAPVGRVDATVGPALAEVGPGDAPQRVAGLGDVPAAVVAYLDPGVGTGRRVVGALGRIGGRGGLRGLALGGLGTGGAPGGLGP